MTIKHHVGVPIESNSYEDKGEGVISFPDGLVITDNSTQRNGTSYDIDSLDLSEYSNKLTANHSDKIDNIIGKVTGLVKNKSNVTISGIKFAIKESAYARLAYNLMKGGYLTDLSTETYGPAADDSGLFKNSRLIGLSAVVTGNNKNASTQFNEIVTNSISASKEDGLDVTEVEGLVQNSAATETVEEPKESEVVAEDNAETEVGAAVGTVTEDAEPEEPADTTEEEEELTKEEKDNHMSKTDVTDVAATDVENKVEATVDNSLVKAIETLQAKIESLEENAFDKSAKEPEFQAAEKRNLAKNNYSNLSWQERHALQIDNAWDMLVRHDGDASKKLREINEFNLGELKNEGVVQNSMTIADFGNFVISREMLTEIEGQRNDYTPLIAATSWKETLSTQMAWLTRNGDVNMQEVEFCDDDANGNLKPISEYSANIDTANLHELAAVTPVCNAATRFLAVDLLGDVAAGYRNDYDRKRAQLVVARLQQAVNATNNKVVYDTSSGGAANPLLSILNSYKKIANTTPNGTFIMNNSSYAEILGAALKAGVNGPLSSIFTTGSVPQMFGRPFIVVSDDLMPALNTASPVSITVEGSTVSVTTGLFYADLSKFTGRTSGGLQYDLSTDAAYEVSSVVKSAFQRNELILRGSFFRGGAIVDPTKVAAVTAPGVS